MTGWIGRHYQEDIALAQIGREVGLHPNYAMSLFRAACGMSVWSYVTRLRLAHAQRLLATTGLLHPGYRPGQRFRLPHTLL